MKRFLLSSIYIVVLIGAAGTQIYSQNALSGMVRDQNSHVVAGAAVTLRNSQTRAVRSTVSSMDGIFSFTKVAPGEYSLRVLAEGFALSEQSVRMTTFSVNDLVVTLSIGESRLTVTAEVGQAEEARNVAQAVSVIGAESIAERATSVLAQVGEEEAGLNMQRTSPTIGAWARATACCRRRRCSMPTAGACRMPRCCSARSWCSRARTCTPKICST